MAMPYLVSNIGSAKFKFKDIKEFDYEKIVYSLKTTKAIRFGLH